MIWEWIIIKLFPITPPPAPAKSAPLPLLPLLPPPAEFGPPTQMHPSSSWNRPLTLLLKSTPSSSWSRPPTFYWNAPPPPVEVYPLLLKYTPYSSWSRPPPPKNDTLQMKHIPLVQSTLLQKLSILFWHYPPFMLCMRTVLLAYLARTNVKSILDCDKST